MIDILTAAVGAVAAVTKRIFSWSDVWAGHAGVNKPFDEKKAKIEHGYREWWQRELVRPGATLTGAAPEEVDAALINNQRARIAALGRYGSKYEAEIREERERLFAEEDAAAAAADRASARRREFDRQYAKFEAACGRPLPRPIPDLVSENDYHAWRAQALRVLHPPAPRPAVAPTENRLVIG